VNESKTGASGRGALAELKEAMGNLFESVLGLAPDLGIRQEFPRHELRVEDDAYRVRVELPGFKREEIEVTVTGKSLAIAGERPRFQAPAGAKMLRSERPAGKFDLNIRLPGEVDAVAVVAQMREGILEVRLPKQQAHRGRSIRVETDEESAREKATGDEASRTPWEGGSPGHSSDTGGA